MSLGNQQVEKFSALIKSTYMCVFLPSYLHTNIFQYQFEVHLKDFGPGAFWLLLGPACILILCSV